MTSEDSSNQSRTWVFVWYVFMNSSRGLFVKLYWASMVKVRFSISMDNLPHAEVSLLRSVSCLVNRSCYMWFPCIKWFTHKKNYFLWLWVITENPRKTLTSPTPPDEPQVVKACHLILHDSGGIPQLCRVVLIVSCHNCYHCSIRNIPQCNNLDHDGEHCHSTHSLVYFLNCFIHILSMWLSSGNLQPHMLNDRKMIYWLKTRINISTKLK